MKVEVRRFAGDSYTVHYCLFRLWPFMTEWGRIDRSTWSFPGLIRRKDVFLMSFDQAEELAKSLTPEMVTAHERELDEAYELAVANTKRRLSERKERGFTVNR